MSETIVREFVKLFMEALNNLYDKESSIIANEVNERCMAAHLFAFMKNSLHKYLALNPYQVDFEYNREGLSGLPKRLCCQYKMDEKARRHLIIPDLIIHKRGDASGAENLVVIEFKKWGIPYGDDIVKLSEMTKQDNDGSYKYKFGCHVIFGPIIDQTKIELLVDGESVESRQFTELNSLPELLIRRLKDKNLLSDSLCLC